MIDLSLMRGVRVDPERRRAWVEGGATWGDVDRETQAFGLATPGGLISDTGVAGLTLSGGIGWLRSRYGLCIDNLTAADVVTADGRLVHAGAGGERRPAMGAQGRRRQLRRGDDVRVRAPPRRSQDDVLRSDLSARGGRRTDPLLARFSARQERRCGIVDRVLDHTARPDLSPRVLGKAGLSPWPRSTPALPRRARSCCNPCASWRSR